MASTYASTSRLRLEDYDTLLSLTPAQKASVAHVEEAKSSRPIPSKVSRESGKQLDMADQGIQ